MINAANIFFNNYFVVLQKLTKNGNLNKKCFFNKIILNIVKNLQKSHFE